ncbi:hypothetical protein [Xenorhabdus littoralis]|uniref:hypothetical protein n=1 Tax=Xenorhabdus littoralis TaxID=2582835 RepID=UPI0029E821D3|nr:hypothetical protein [Xenorhabdus sp. psl]MDX7992056.1 beta-lactamase family protein [Xenorhabdus sp. psl]
MQKNIKIIRALNKFLVPFDKNSPGFVYIAKYDNGLTYQGSVGLACLESHKSLSIDSVFKYLPDLGNYAEPVTLRHLIYHTGGLVDYMELAESDGISELDPLTTEQSLHHLYAQSQSIFLPE